MKSTHRPIVGALLGLSLVASCRDSGGTANPGPDTMPIDMPTAIHIQDVQSDTMPVNTPVELHGVIVTAVDAFGTRTGDIWVEEAGGGPFSGVHVFGAPVTQVSSLRPGDVVDITGAIKTEFAISSDTSGRTVTELQAPKGAMLTITKTGTATVPAPAVVDALAIGQKSTQAARDAEWEKWEGVLITLSNISAFGEPACITSGGNCTDPTFTSFSITGVAKAESSLTAFPTPAVKTGDCFKGITGVVDYAFDYLIYPRSATDIATGGTSCPPRELGSANLCVDGVDNDGNGFSDCGDFGCEVGPDAWLGTSCGPGDTKCGCSTNFASGMGAAQVNAGATGPVLLHDMFVSAVGTSGFWIADDLQAAPNGGVFVFTGSTAVSGVVVGAKLATVQGLASQFGSKTQKLPELGSVTIGTIGAGGIPMPITNVTAAQLVDLANGAVYAGSLVTLSNLKVTVAANTAGQIQLKDNNGTTITMDDGAFANYGGSSLPVGTCFATLSGVMDLQTTAQIRTINPRAATDIVATGGTCN